MPPNEEAEIIDYCVNTMCPASEEAVRELAAKGYTKVRNYVEGKRAPKTPDFPTKVANS